MVPSIAPRARKKHVHADSGTLSLVMRLEQLFPTIQPLFIFSYSSSFFFPTLSSLSVADEARNFLRAANAMVPFVVLGHQLRHAKHHAGKLAFPGYHSLRVSTLSLFTSNESFGSLGMLSVTSVLASL